MGRSAGGYGGSSGGSCYNCGQPGQLSRDCPEPRQERSGGGSYGRSDDRSCYNCGGTGHISRDCPEPRQERSGGGYSSGGRSCYNCGQSGHLSRECPNRSAPAVATRPAADRATTAASPVTSAASAPTPLRTNARVETSVSLLLSELWPDDDAGRFPQDAVTSLCHQSPEEAKNHM